MPQRSVPLIIQVFFDVLPNPSSPLTLTLNPSLSRQTSKFHLTLEREIFSHLNFMKMSFHLIIQESTHRRILRVSHKTSRVVFPNFGHPALTFTNHKVFQVKNNFVNGLSVLKLKSFRINGDLLFSQHAYSASIKCINLE